MSAASTGTTRDLFLWCLSVTYLFAFTSLFVQSPGLYGDNGVLPAKLVLEEEASSFQDLVVRQPTLLRLLPRIGFDVEAGLDFLCLGGALLAFVAMISRDQRNCVVFTALWTFYLSVFQVGQTFLWFKWDVLLLEAGFLAILAAPLTFFGFHKSIRNHAHDRITFWLVRWLLFRVTFASGVSKLIGDNQTSWWSLEAVSQHYETQYLPTPIAWYFHQLPDWVQKLSAVGTLISQLAVSLFILSPVRHQRILAFYSQIFIAIIMMMTGNYGFYVVLTLTLSLSLLDDDWLRSWTGKVETGCKNQQKDASNLSQWTETLRFYFSIVTYGALVFGVMRFFNFAVKSAPSRIESSLNFDANNFEVFVQITVILTTCVGAGSVAWQIISAIIGSRNNEKSDSTRRITEVVGCVTLGSIATVIFAISLVPHIAVCNKTGFTMPLALRDVQSWTSKQFQLTNSYVFNTRTNDEDFDGRNEVVLEGSDYLENGWMEYDFRFKPGNVSSMPPIVSPHQPRLDFQMWFTARLNYKQNYWLLNLVYRLLTNQKEVLQLLGENPFGSSPPKYIRASLYTYQFTSKEKGNDRYSDNSWWIRERVGDYLPVVSLEDPSFVDYIQRTGLQQSEPTDDVADQQPTSATTAKTTFACIRSIIGQSNNNCACLLIVFAGFLLTLFDPSLELFSTQVIEPASSGSPRYSNGFK